MKWVSKWFAAKDAGSSDTGCVTAGDRGDHDMLGKTWRI